MMSYRGKKVTVVGLARSGIAAARLLNSLGARVRVTESQDTNALRQAAEELRSEGISVEIGAHTADFLEGADLLVVSPGVRPDALPVVRARESGIDVIGELELASSVCPATIVAITGTNGKTTTTTLVGEVLKAAGLNVFVLGNIGRPFSSSVLSTRSGDFVVLEISSFQLETISDFHPKVAVILNVTPDHLDRYAGVAQYLEAKKRITINQGQDDWLILNHGDEALRALVHETRARVRFFNQEKNEGGFDQNQMAVLAVADALGIECRLCLKIFKDFKGVEHRMEFVRELNGIVFINDSKATNIDSTTWALNNIKRPVVLIAGGRDKGSDFGSIGPLVRQKVKSAVLVGEVSDRIADAWKGVLPFVLAETFEEAVTQAYRKASAGDCVLFSPMCKSFDMFTDYEHRGRIFKEIVNKLK